MAAAPGKKKPPTPPKPPLGSLTGQGEFSKERCSRGPHQGEGKELTAEKQIPLLKTKTEVPSTREPYVSVIKSGSERPSIKPPLLPKPQTPPKPLANLSKSVCPSSKPIFAKRPHVIIPPERNGKEQPTSPINRPHVKAPVAKLEEFDNFCDGPLRPPRSPKSQPFKGEPFKIFQEKPELPLKKKQLQFSTSNFESQWQITKAKSASLGRTNAFRFVEAKTKSASLGRNKNADFASYVKNQSELENKSTPIPPPRQKKKHCDHSHTIPVYAQVNYSMKKNRRLAAKDVECTECSEEQIEDLAVVEGKLVLPGVKHIKEDETEIDKISQVNIIQISQTDTEQVTHSDTENFSQINTEKKSHTDTIQICQQVTEQISQPDTKQIHLTDFKVSQAGTESQEVNEDKDSICKGLKLELSDNIVNGFVISEDKNISAFDVISVDNDDCSTVSSLEASIGSVVKANVGSNQESINDTHIQNNNSELYRIIRLKSESSDNCDAHICYKNDLVEECTNLVSVKESKVNVSQVELEECISEKYVVDNTDLTNFETTSQEPQNQKFIDDVFDDKRSGNELFCDKTCTNQSVNDNSKNQVTLNKECRLSTSSLPTRKNLGMKELGKFHRRRQSWSCKDGSSSPEKHHNHKRKSRTQSWWCDDGDLSSGTMGDLDSSDAARQSSFEEVEWDGSDTELSGTVRSKLSCWLGSFGKGNRKHKTRRSFNSNSQFYCDSEDSTLEKKQNSTLQIPQISEVDVDGFNKDLDDSRPASGLSTLSALDIDDKSETRVSVESFEIYQHSESENEAEQNANSRDENLFESEESHLNKKAFYTAQELMTSERVFIDVLKLLNVDFRDAVRAASSEYSIIPSAELDKILNSLPQLQHLNEDLLRDLEDRIENWCSVKKIADVIVRKGPFLKLYTSYIKNFEFQCSYLEDCCQKYPKFAKVVREFEASPRCQKLSLKHYMLKPVQRIPQYRLLLEDYLRNLSPSSPDLEDTKTALKIVCDVADHANRSIKLGDHLSKLLQLQSQLGNYEIIKPGRVFLKDGELFKLSRKGMQPRYFILLNDCLLYTSYNGSVQSSGLKVNYELPLSSMKVNTPQAEDYRNEFSIISVRRSFTLCARSLQERQEWVDTLQKAIMDYVSRQKSFQNTKLSLYCGNENSTEPFKLGQEAPVWIQDSRVTMCQTCTAEFTVTFRRHHCRACGKVVCGDCSDFRAPLQYMRFQSARVCEECHDTLLKEAKDPSSKMHQAMRYELGNTAKITDFFKRLGPASGRKVKKYIPQRLKEVTANDTGSQMSGWLQRRSRRSWKRLWFVLKEQVLYVYKASEDVVALESLPVLGYTVEPMKERHFQMYEGIDAKLVFQLAHPGQQPHIFHADNEHLANRWIAAMSDATVLK